MSEIAQVRVMIVDDHALMRRGIATVLSEQEGIRVVGEAANGSEAIAKAKELAPDVIFMDLNMPVCSGLEAIQTLQAEMPQTNILVLTISENDEDLFAAIRFGASGYLLKNAEPEELIQAIHQVALGGAVVSPFMASKLLAEFTQKTSRLKMEDANTSLSPREEEVLQQLSQGLTNKQIADLLFISENTVKYHAHSILEKLNLPDRRAAAKFAVEHGLTH